MSFGEHHALRRTSSWRRKFGLFGVATLAVLAGALISARCQGAEKPAGETAKSPSADKGGDDAPIYLPGWEVLRHKDLVKGLGITEAQRAELRKIQKEMWDEARKIEADNKALGREKLMAAFEEWQEGVEARLRDRVPAVFSPEQLKKLKHFSIREKDFSCWTYPAATQMLGIDKEQEAAIRPLQQEMMNRYRSDMEKAKKDTMAVLTPEQRTKLRDAVLGPCGGGGNVSQLVLIPGTSRSMAIPTSSPFPDLSNSYVQKQYGLSEEQQAKIRAILGDSRTMNDRLAKEVAEELSSKDGANRGRVYEPYNMSFVMESTAINDDSAKRFSPEEAKKRKADAERDRITHVKNHKLDRLKRWSEYESQPVVKMSVELRKQMEGVLTPEQLDKYKAEAFNRCNDMVTFDIVIQEETGINEEQRAAFERVFGEMRASQRKTNCELNEKLLKILTPEQQERLEKVIASLESRPRTMRSSSVPKRERGSDRKNTSDISGVVLLPNGSPAVDAKAALCTKYKLVTVMDGRLTSFNTVETGKNGAFRVAGESEPWLLVVAHDEGYIELTAAEFAKTSGKVQLRPWGRVEGQCSTERRSPDVVMENFIIGADGRREGFNLVYHYSVSSDFDAKFKFKRLPPVTLQFAPLFSHGRAKTSVILGNPRRSYVWESGRAVVESGKTTQVKLPQPGRPVVGRVVLPPGSKLQLADLDIAVSVVLRPPAPSGSSDDVKETLEAYREFLKSTLGKPYQLDGIAVGDDGTFRIENMPETEYIIQVRASGEGLKSEATASKRVTVPPLSESKEPVDVGNLMLKEP